MRDLNLIREEGDAESGARKMALLGLAAGSTMVLVLALFLEVGASAPAAAEADDPLAALARVEPTAVPEGPPEVDAPAERVDPLALTFPGRLAADGERPEIAAALAAADAELAHPDPIPATSAAELATRIPAVLPASVAATTDATSLARAAVADPMVRDAIPQARVGEAAPEGHDGEFTVQVISYDSPEGAHAFAAGLRARGHRAYVMQAEVPGRGTVYRVRVGPFETMASATQYRHDFEETEHMNTIVVRRRS